MESDNQEAPDKELEKTNSNAAGLSIFNVFQTLAKSQQLLIGVFFLIFFASIAINFGLLFGPTEIADTTSGSSIQIALILIAILSICFAFWSSHVRTISLKDGPAMVPEKWGGVINHLSAVSAQNTNQLNSALTFLQRSQLAQSEKSEELLESFLTLQRALSERDAEISRLKSGYDSQIYRRFVKKFIRIANELNEMLIEVEGTDGHKNYVYLVRLMRDALEECGVEEFEPKIGADFRQAGLSVSDDPLILPTDNSADDFKIASIQAPGYALEAEENPEVIIPAKVSIFRFDREKKANKS